MKTEKKRNCPIKRLAIKAAILPPSSVTCSQKEITNGDGDMDQRPPESPSGNPSEYPPNNPPENLPENPTDVTGSRPTLQMLKPFF